ncbi:hypothetical protein Nepgr_008352 [Nepenthes gracilis]|uniref:Uncharacterized protein n=1 Tax=Nepenthes gracilis TaxID=150966 RepID=A0AAD3S9C7_NEPGR|nr:hypothetical protein Nepgr_008352 [Nepenthes gracilis]
MDNVSLCCFQTCMRNECCRCLLCLGIFSRDHKSNCLHWFCGRNFLCVGGRLVAIVALPTPTDQNEKKVWTNMNKLLEPYSGEGMMTAKLVQKSLRTNQIS